MKAIEFIRALSFYITKEIELMEKVNLPADLLKGINSRIKEFTDQFPKSAADTTYAAGFTKTCRKCGSFVRVVENINTISGGPEYSEFEYECLKCGKICKDDIKILHV